MKRFKVTHFFAYKNVAGELVESGERMNDNVQAENENEAAEKHLEMVKANEPDLVEVYFDRTIVEEYQDPAESAGSVDEAPAGAD